MHPASVFSLLSSVSCLLLPSVFCLQPTFLPSVTAPPSTDSFTLAYQRRRDSVGRFVSGLTATRARAPSPEPQSRSLSPFTVDPGEDDHSRSVSPFINIPDNTQHDDPPSQASATLQEPRDLDTCNDSLTMADALRAPTLFHGDGEQEGENPQDFMNTLELSFMMRPSISDDDKIKTFRLKLKASSVAKEWFTELPLAEKATWAQLHAAFEKRWPEKTTPTRTREEKLAELKQAVLNENQLWQKEKVNGIDEWTHIAWADRVQRLAEAIPDDKGLLVAETRDKMPAVLRRLVGAEYSTWVTFCDAVRKISLTALREAIEFEGRLVTKDDLERAQLNASTKALTRSMQSMTLGPRAPAPHFQPRIPQPSFQPASTHTQPRNPPAHPQNTQFRQSTPNTQFRQSTPSPRPDAERFPDIARLALTIHPDTPAGRALYAMQLTTWQVSSAGRGPNELRPYPLSPGTSPVASGECWGCGYTGHMRGACTNPPVPALETRWRSIAAGIRNRAVAAGVAVNFIDMEEAEEGEFISGTVLEEFLAWKSLNQGKAEGSST